jgi:molecular chaperone DnaK
MGKAVGIDLGTTNSVVATIEATQPTVIVSADGLRTTASIVAYGKQDRTFIGHMAKRQNVMNPENTFYSVKRFIGTKMEDLDPEFTKVSYKISGDENSNVLLECPILNRKFRPEEISAQILRKLADDAEVYLKQKVDQAVITVPAYFNDSQRQATQDAGKIAGLEILRIINEPTAASLAYGLEKNTNEVILVFDLGGGTFDVSILEVGDGIFEVLSTSGDTYLGGDNFDKIVIDHLLAEFKKIENIDLSDNVQTLQRITSAAEKAKIDLSTQEETTVNLPFVTANEDGPKHLVVTITRTKFNELCSGLISRCRVPVETALQDADLTKEQINKIVLVGGSTRIPAVQEIIKDVLGKEPNQGLNPDEVVALGAAIQAGIISGDVRNVLLLDLTPLSLGIETLGGVFSRMIPRNTTIPTKATETFSTAMDNQASVEITIQQGEREFAKDNKTLGVFRLNGIEPAPRGTPQIEVTFDIDVNGILSVTARDKGNGKEQSITISNASNLNNEEIEKIIENSKKFADADKKSLTTTNLENEINNLCYQVDKNLSDAIAQSTVPVSDELKQKVETLLETVRKDLTDKNFKQLKTAVESLQNMLTEIQAWAQSNSK